MGSMLARAERLIAINRAAEALPLLRSAAAEAPNDFDVLSLLAHCLYQLDELEPALDAARAASAVRSHDDYPFRLASVTLARLGDSRSAVDTAYTAVARAPLSWRTHATLARALAADRQGRAARLAAEQAVRLAPAEPQAYATVGQVAQALNRPRQARAAYQKALRLAPLDPVITSQLASVDAGPLAQIHGYAAVAALNPGDPELDYRPEAAARGLMSTFTLLVAAVAAAAAHLAGSADRTPAPTGLRIGFVLVTWLAFGGFALVIRRRLAGPGEPWLRRYFNRPSVRAALTGYLLSIAGLAWMPFAADHRAAWPATMPLFFVSALNMLVLAFPAGQWQKLQLKGRLDGIAGLNEGSRLGAEWPARRGAWTLVALTGFAFTAAQLGGLAALGDDGRPAWPVWVRVLYLLGVLAVLIALGCWAWRQLTETGIRYLRSFLRRPAVLAVLTIAIGAFLVLGALPLRGGYEDASVIEYSLAVDLGCAVVAINAARFAERRRRREVAEHAREVGASWTRSM